LNPIFLTEFWEVVAWIVMVFFWVLVIWMFVAIFTDIFRRRDLSGIAKALWIFLIFILPLLGILIYMIARPADATREQDMELMAAQRRAAGYSSTDEIARAKQLLDAGAITQAEFDNIKQRALM
jgi:predicted membrane channel-forming protein YqfA (hemolysin III family)